MRRVAFAAGGLLGCLICTLAILLQAAPTSAVAQGPADCDTFDDPGRHVFEVPEGVTEIEATVFGAQGGDVLPVTNPQLGSGGLGGGATDVSIPVTPGELLEIVVGGSGKDSTGGQNPAPVGGFNGGGDGARGSAHTSTSGGGASQINRAATTLVITGGGGGGAHGGDGGDGGLTGTDGTKHPGSALDSTPGLSGGNGGAGGAGDPAVHDGGDGTSAGGGNPGAGGRGGGGTPLPIDGGGGGGGGFVGGGGGGGGASPGNSATGGGGGSSFDSTGTATFQTGVQEGDGLITLTYDCVTPPPPFEACVTFDEAGDYTFDVPAGLNALTATVYGAAGGTVQNAQPAEGGLGGGATNLEIPVTPGQTLDIVVGGAGADVPAAAGPGGAGGTPGGGGGGGQGTSTRAGAGGGGASEVLRGGTQLVIGGGGGGGGGASAAGVGGDGGFIGTDGANVLFGAITGGFAGGNGGLGGFGAFGVPAGTDGSPGQGGTGGGPAANGGGGGGGGAVGGGGGGGGGGAGAGGGGSSSHSLGNVPVTWATGVEEGDGRVELAFDCADVAITKDAELVDATTIEYTVTVENLGPNDATGVVATDPLPEQVTYDSDDCGGSADASGWTWNIGDLAVGADVTCVITVTTDEVGTIDNTSSVDMDQVDLNPDNNSDPASVFIPSADLRLEKTSEPAIVDPSGQVTWTLTVTNLGPDPSTGSTVTDTLPPEVTNVAAQTAGCTVQGNAVSCDVGALDVDGSTDITITGTAPSTLSTCFDNAGSVTGDEADPDPDNNDDAARTCTPPVADLALAKTADAVVDPGGEVTWTLTVTNEGPNPSTGSTVTDTLPAAITNVAAQTAGCTVQDNTVTCDVGPLEVDASANIVLTGDAPSAPSTCFENAGSVEGIEGDPVLANNDASVETCTAPPPPAGKPRLKVKKRASTDGAHPGEVISYRITVRNKGNRDARRVRVCDRLPSGQKLLRAPGADQRSGKRVCWKLKRLKAGAKKTFKVVTQIKFGSKLGTQRNKAIVKAGNAKRKTDVAAVAIVAGTGPCPDVGPGSNRC